MSRVYKIVSSVILVIILVPSILIGACVVRVKRYERKYAQVEAGQSKQSVVDALGEPSDVQGCYGPTPAGRSQVNVPRSIITIRSWRAGASSSTKMARSSGSSTMYRAE